MPSIYRSDFRTIFVACQISTHVGLSLLSHQNYQRFKGPRTLIPAMESFNFTGLQFIGRKIMDVDCSKV